MAPRRAKSRWCSVTAIVHRKEQQRALQEDLAVAAGMQSGRLSEDAARLIVL